MGAVPLPAASARLEGFPAGLALRGDGVWFESGEEDRARPFFVCSVVWVVAQCQSPSGEGWGRLVESVDPDGRTHQWVVPDELFAGDGREVFREALKRGARIGSSRRARAAFPRLLQEWRVAARAVTTDRPG